MDSSKYQRHLYTTKCYEKIQVLNLCESNFNLYDWRYVLKEFPLLVFTLNGIKQYYLWSCLNLWIFSASLAIPTSSTGGGPVAPICVVSTVEIMTQNGWKDINNITQDFQQPFQLYRENEKTYLQVGTKRLTLQVWPIICLVDGQRDPPSVSGRSPSVGPPPL